MDLSNTNLLLASLIWGSIGIGYFIYGKRQQSIVPWIGGLLMIVASYFASSALVMSLICLALMVGVHLLVKQGY
ncbi:MAG: amino acid transport protein [Candidatus Omnitrophica bacterium]|nr:amino acid transport protein [Candidatus Omnitrophota bacterium]